MDADSWNDLGSLIVNVLALPPEERTDFLDEVCREDAALRAEVESLLAAYDAAPGYFESLADGLIPGLDASGEPPDDVPAIDPYLLVGKEVAHYRVVRYLGGGGMGVVYQAEDTRLKRTVALKFLPPVWSQDEQARRRFLQEAQAASALDHPNICTVYEVNETSAGQFFIAMACYDGETLKQKVARGPLTIETALRYAVLIGEGLAQAHARGIVHRDIKPANVMVTGDEQVKILDFGLAKLSGGVQITRSGTTLGTVAYMAPEQARGEPVDHRADLWSLGAVLYEMIAGRRAFPGDYHQAVLYSVLNLEPPPVTGLRDGVPMQLAHLINKALAKEPEERYQQMGDLLADLKAVQQRAAVRHSAAHEMQLSLREASPAAPPPRDNADEGRVQILVVDDEPELELLIRQKFRRQVHAAGWSFSFAMDGGEALERLRADPDISLVLTDLNMPGMDGLTLLARLAELDRPIKAVVVSAYGDLANIRTAMNRGAFDFVTKPIDFKDLEKTIVKTHHELLAHRRAAEAQQQLVAMQKELEVARRIQEAILPLSFPKRDEVDLYAFTTTARDVSGTFYDYFLIGDRRVGFLMGDVAGSGVSAALFMAMCQTFLKGIAQQGEAPGACLTSMNRLLFPEGFPDLAVTVFYGLLDLDAGTLSYANAGHPAPYLLREGGVVAPLGGDPEEPVWRVRDHRYRTDEAVLKPGEGLLLFTKGITGATDRHGHVYAAERLAALLRDVHDAEPARLIRAVVRAVMVFMGDAPLADDLTALALRYLR